MEITLYIVGTLVLMGVFLLGPLFFHNRRTNEYKLATKIAINAQLKMYFRDGEKFLHSFPQTNDGGLICITSERIIHKHSDRFNLPFSAEYNLIESIEREGNKITITLKTGRKQIIHPYQQDVLRLFEILVYQLNKGK